MQDWSDGYTTDIAYTHGYYPQLNPLHARFALLASGFVPPEVQTACELGFGQGISVNVHAAASGSAWYGTDFNPAQAAFARELAGPGERAERLSDEAFDLFCRRDDLPDFDFIGLHGIWSWISDANRNVIAEFIKRKLKVGGVLYISYNTQPGWAAIAPLRDLLTGHSEALAARGVGTAQRIDAALDFADRLLAGGALYGRANPAVAQHLKTLRGQNRNYLAHEYFNRDWAPMPFAGMAEWMGTLKLQFGASAHLPDHVPALNLSAEQQQFLAGIPDSNFRETTRDFMVNRRFRSDYWIRGARRLAPLEQAERLRAEHIALTTPLDDIDLTATGALGKSTLNEDIYRPILDTLADQRSRTLGDIERTVVRKGIGLPHVLQAVLILTGKGIVHPAHAPAVVERMRGATAPLNARICQRARYSSDVIYLASPVIGGAITVGRIEQLFLLARGQRLPGPVDWARYAADLLVLQGQRITKDGAALAAPEAQLEELTVQANQFARQKLPLLQALGIAE